MILFKYHDATPQKMESKSNMNNEDENVYLEGNPEVVIVVDWTPTPAPSKYPIIVKPYV